MRPTVRVSSLSLQSTGVLLDRKVNTHLVLGTSIYWSTVIVYVRNLDIRDNTL